MTLVAHGLVKREVNVDCSSQLDVHFGFDVGVDRQQVIGAADGDAVAGIEEHGDVGALRPLAEVEQLFGHLVAGEVGAFDHLEADVAQHAGHRLGVDGRVGQRRDVLVGAVADDESDPTLGMGGTGGQGHQEYGSNGAEDAHLKSPWQNRKDFWRKRLIQTTRKNHHSCSKKYRRGASLRSPVVVNIRPHRPRLA